LVIAILRPEAAKKGDDQETQMTKIGRPKRRAILVMVIVFFLFSAIVKRLVPLNSGRFSAIVK
jgi:hypothetical protein